MTAALLSQHDLVINAIDVISYRKNRPNIARIYRHLVRFSNITSAQCEKVLDELVEQGRVIKVTYKGNISYRNAARWKDGCRRRKKTDDNSSGGNFVGGSVGGTGSKRRSSILSGTVAELAVRVPAYFRTGVPCEILEKYLLGKDGRFTKESIHKLIQKELQQETLVQLDNGNYFLSLNTSNSNSTTSEDSDSIAKNNNEDDENSAEKVVKPVVKDRRKQSLIETINNSDEDNDEYDDFVDDDTDEEDEDDIEIMYEDDDDEEGGGGGTDENEKAIGKHTSSNNNNNNNNNNNSNNKKKKKKKSKSHRNKESANTDLSAESDEELKIIEAKESLKQTVMDEDYRPPQYINIGSGRRSSSGRISDRKKKTRYDASEYVFPALKRPYNNISRKVKCVEQAKPKPNTPSKPLDSKEFKKTLLNPIPKNVLKNLQTSTTSNATANTTSMSRCLEKIRLPEIAMKSVQFEPKHKDDEFNCVECDDPDLHLSKTSGIACCKCNMKAHLACVKPDLVDDTKWLCKNCKTPSCQICKLRVPKDGVKAECSVCRLTYHRFCHVPVAPEDNDRLAHWRCSKCSNGQPLKEEQTPNKTKESINKSPQKKNSTENSLSSNIEKKEKENKNEATVEELKGKITPKPLSSLMKINNSSPVLPSSQLETSPTSSSSTSSSQVTLTDDTLIKEEGSDSEQPPIKVPKLENSMFEAVEEIPDSSAWTAAEVSKYFNKVFDENVANVFLKQEIDGNSLKLLRKSDVLRGLGFKLGVGLNVLYYVRMLQFRTTDLKTLWTDEIDA